jgi:hypothetical protein
VTGPGADGDISAREREALTRERDRARGEYTELMREIEHEMVRFRGEKTGDMRRVLHNLVNLEINHAHRELYGWQGLVPVVEGIEGPAAGVMSNLPAERPGEGEVSVARAEQ